MQAHDWERLRETLADALALAPDEREAYVAAALAHEPLLFAEARDLLALERSAERLEPTGAGAQVLTTLEGRRIGPWRVEAPLGSGGMGSVHRVVREGDGLRAALKLLNLGQALSPSGVRRFRSERRLLARLEHPGIARLIDGGVTEDGLPFLVLEYVEGLPLDRHARERGLDVRERVRLFRGVCAAVAYAHQHLIVHRDLKPANILVDADGRARLLDFGIAKLLDSDEPEEVTRPGERPMTPRYASPEQVRGEPLSTASDVYSLGVVLYELLCGVSPYAGAGAGPELERAVRDATPDAPSTAVGRSSEARSPIDARRLRRQLAGDLDRIVLRALAKEPARRYAGAAELDDDLGRWLDGLPVRARPDSALYRLRRFAARHRAVLFASVALLASLAAGVAATAREARLARAAERSESAARERAERHFDRARALIDDLVFGVHDRIERLPGATPARRFALERARDHLAALTDDVQLRERLGPELAATWMRLAQVQGTRTVGSEGDVAAALESTRRARDLYAAAFDDAPEDLERIDDLCDAERQLGDLLREAGDPRTALERYARVEEVVGLGLALEPTHAGLRRQRALAAGQRGRILMEQSHTPQARAELERAIALLTASAPAAPERETERDLSLFELRLAECESELGAHERSLELRRTACARAQRLALAEPLDAQLALDAAAAEVDLAEGLRRMAVLDEAEERIVAAVERLRELHAADPSNQLPRRRLLAALESLGALALERGRPEEALETFEEARDLAEAGLAASRGDSSTRIDLARLETVLGDALWSFEDREQAQACFQRALDLLREAGEGVEARRVRFAARIGLADATTHAGRTQEALDLLEELLQLAARDRSAHPDSAWPLRNRALAGWRLAGLLEARGADAARARDERVDLLLRARELFAEGRDLAEDMARRGWLTTLERRKDVAALFAADVERIDRALLGLGVDPDS